MMNNSDLAAGIANNYRFWSDQQTVTLTNEATEALTNNIIARVDSFTYKEAMLGGSLGLEPTDQVLVLAAATLNGAIPAQGFTITDGSGTAWTIISAVGKSFAGVPYEYRCIVRKQK